MPEWYDETHGPRQAAGRDTPEPLVAALRGGRRPGRAPRCDPAAPTTSLQWQVLRATTPLREIAQHPESGPIPVAAAHAAEALQVMLGVIAASQHPVATGDIATLAKRESLQRAIDNANVLLKMLDVAGQLSAGSA